MEITGLNFIVNSTLDFPYFRQQFFLNRSYRNLIKPNLYKAYGFISHIIVFKQFNTKIMTSDLYGFLSKVLQKPFRY